MPTLVLRARRQRGVNETNKFSDVMKFVFMDIDGYMSRLIQNIILDNEAVI